MNPRGRILVLWNQVEEDVYETWRNEGPKTLDWDPSRAVPDVGTVAEEMAGFIDGLREGGFHVDIVNIEDDLERMMSSIRLHQPDAVFNTVEYFNDDQVQEAWVAGLYELMGVDYTGSRPIALSTCQNKYRTKLILEAAGLPTSPYFIAHSEPIPNAEEDYELDFPLIIKPAYEDASGGIERKSVVHSQEELETQVRRVLKEFRQPALVEEYVEGREIHAAVLGNGDTAEVLPLFEMEFDDSEFNPEEEWRPQIISFQAKWDPHSKDFYTMDAVVPPQDLDEEVAEYVRDIAKRAYKALGCRDYARIDTRVDEDGEVYILEVNPNPDLVDGSAYMMCATASGRTYSEALSAIADMAVARARKPPEPTEADKSGLPSDDLLRAHVLRQREAGKEKAGEDSRPAGADSGVASADSEGASADLGAADTGPSDDEPATPRE